MKGKWEVGGGGGRGRDQEKVEGELIDKNLSSTSMGNLSGREGRRCEKKEKKKEEKRGRGNKNQYLRRGETGKNPKQLNHTHKTSPFFRKEFLIHPTHKTFPFF